MKSIYENNNIISKMPNKRGKYKKKSIPKALRQQTWIRYFGKKFEHKCYTSWCKNKIDVFNFHVGHDIPESKGGKLELENLRPICSNCNLSMSNNYTIGNWNKLQKRRWYWRYICC